MKTTFAIAVAILCSCVLATAQDALPKAFLDGNGADWRSLGEPDFVNVNCAPDTWSFNNGQIQCTGKPTGVMRMKDPLTNFELVIEWMHQKPAGNSGVFLWATQKSIDDIVAKTHRGPLPDGIEVQILDHGFKDNYLASPKGKDKDPKALFFSTNGDVFPTGATKMTPFPPTSPNGQRSFPKKDLCKGHGNWNHYYVRAINGEVRLWVNGEEVSGGKDCTPATGYLCLESEGSPIEFRNFRLRILP